LTTPVSPEPPSEGVPVVSQELLDFSRATNSHTLTFTLSNVGGEPLDFRILSSQPWLSASPFEGRVSGQPVTIIVNVDAANIGGDPTAFLAVNTSAGYKRVDASVTTTMRGAWSGTLSVSSPISLGDQQLIVQLEETSGVISGWVDAGKSFLFPFNAAISGTVVSVISDTIPVPGSAADQVTFSFSLPGTPGSIANPASTYPVIRDFTFTGTRTGASTLTGTFTETFRGLVGGTAPQLSGTATFVRTGAPASGSAASDPNLTLSAIDNPYEDASGAVRTAYAACTSCPGGACTADPIANGTAFLKYAPGGVPKLAFYNAFWAVANSASGNPFSSGSSNIDTCAATGTCAIPYDSFYLKCAQYWYWKATTNASSRITAMPRYLDALEVPADYALYLGNASVAFAFDSWFVPNRSLSNEVSTLASGEQVYAAGLRSSDLASPTGFLDPAIAGIVNGLDAIAVSEAAHSILTEAPLNAGLDSERSAGEHFRRVLRTIDGAIFAANERASRERRLFQTTQAADTVRRGAVRAYLDLAAISPALGKAPSLFAGELALLHAALQTLGGQFSEIQQGRNPLGFAPAFVPFYWSKDDTRGTTNYQQIKASADSNWTLWKSLYEDTNNASRTYESAAGTLGTELSRQVSTINNEIAAICGEGVDTLERCGSDFGGTNTSEMARQLLEIQASVIRVHQMQLQMTNLSKEIDIEEDRAAEIAQVHVNNAMLIDETGRKIAANDEALRIINTSQQIVQTLIGGFTGVISNGGPNPNPVGMVASVLGALSSAAVTGFSAAAREKYERDNAALATHQQMQIEFSVAEAELINSAAVVKLKLLQMGSLQLDLDLALINLSQSKGQLKALYDRVSRLVADRARVQALTEASARHALHYRVFANYTARQAAVAFGDALEWAYLATRALEYQRNMTINTAPLWGARSPNDLTLYLQSLANLAASSGTAQQHDDVISLRDEILGFNTPVKDVATSEVVSPRDRFRQFVADPRNRDENGNFHIRFSTASVENPLFSSSLGSDRIRSIRINLIGDNLGAYVTTANVRLVHGGTSYLRSLTKGPDGVAPLIAYDVSGEANQPGVAVVQAGINAPYSGSGVPTSLPENAELQERAVLAGPWELIIDQSSNEPGNANLNLFGLDDIQLIFKHDAYTIP
jgi:hypothetical protein